ncbi:MAG: HNH endonuclease [Spirochaetes bacterium]|nr:HNH endonuclease [Spirochaetota bacterium]
MSSGFTVDDKIKCLLWCERHCCLCEESCGTDIVFHHLVQVKDGGSNNIDNAIPLCLKCHSDIKKYNKDHPIGNEYRIKEITARRDQIYEKHTQHLVPPIYFNITQVKPNRENTFLPDVRIDVEHKGNSLPVKCTLKVQVYLGNKDLGIVKTSQYTGERLWNLNPRCAVRGHFQVPSEVVDSTEQLELRVYVTITDQYERKHELLPLAWVYMRDKNLWYLEPCGDDT